ncbi:MAG: iron chelate uptake ABC transporter family permease subunit [Candidatus Dojkabacteria bacterium]|nr:iron chelate uptake ABC transporter family permease subunit [Candidatus Dojkabacteria bacterium]
MDKKHKEKILFWGFLSFLLILLFISIVLGILVGPVPISIRNIFSITLYKLGLLERGDWLLGVENIVWLIRFPRVLLALAVGGGLAVAGATLQTLVRNPLADPYILGISSGASVGAVLAIGLGFFSFMGVFGVQIAGFIGAVISFFLVYYLAKTGGEIRPNRLILAGMGVGYVFSGITSFITMTSGNRELAGKILAWTLGSLARATWYDLTLPFFILVLVTTYLLFQGRNLNALSVGDEVAVTLGLDVGKFRNKTFILVALLTGIMVSVSGMIGFIGLIIPHVVRIIVGFDHRKVLIISTLLGSIFLIWVDVVARTAFSPTELPVGIITSLLGGPFFLLLLWKIRKQRRIYEDQN